jgi:tetratricopeptide (TPR) repeat protein
MSGRTENYWVDIAKARDLDGLMAAIARDPATAPEALAELTNLLEHFDSISVSSAVDQLQWLGSAIASVADEPQARAGFSAQRLQRSAMDLLHRGARAEAVSRFARAVSMASQAGQTQRAFRVSLISVNLLLSLGEFGAGLDAAEELLSAAEGWSFATRQTRSMLYQLAQCTKKAPAGDRWAAILARIESGMHHAGDQPLASAVASYLAQTLTRSGSYEDAADLLADAKPMLDRMRMQGPGSDWLPVPESSEAHFWRARALDLLGNEDLAEEGYRSHPAFADPAAAEHDELTSRLVELLIENDHLQEALDMIESSEPDREYQSLVAGVPGTDSYRSAAASAERRFRGSGSRVAAAACANHEPRGSGGRRRRTGDSETEEPLCSSLPRRRQADPTHRCRAGQGDRSVIL